MFVKNDFWSYANGTVARTENAEGAKNNAAIVAWDKTMSPSELCHIKHCSTSKEVWRKLEEVYHSRGPARKTTLLKQLLFTKMRDGGSIPDSYENFRCAIEARDELPTPEALKIKLLEEFNTRKEKEIQKEQHSQGAFYAKFGKKNKPQQSKNDSQRKTGEQSGNPKNGNGPNFQQKTTSATTVTR